MLCTGCGARYAYVRYSDGTMRYEFLQRFNGTYLMVEWREVASWGEFETAFVLFEEATHGWLH